MIRIIKIFLNPEARSRGNPISETTDVFDLPEYRAITECRLAHLRTMKLPFTGKTVIDVGSGIGRLSEFFDEQGCSVHCVDGRVENIARLKELYPHRSASVADLENDDLLSLGKFDVVFCYGLLYHVVDVLGAIRRLGSLCREFAVIETCIAPVPDNVLFLALEKSSNPSQALRSYGSRPSPLFVTTCLRQVGFTHIYAPKTLPAHEQFGYKQTKIGKWDQTLLKRDIFVASRKPMANPQLIERHQAR